MGSAPADQSVGLVTAAVARMSAMVASATEAASRALFSGTSFVNREIATVEVRAV